MSDMIVLTALLCMLLWQVLNYIERLRHELWLMEQKETSYTCNKPLG